MEGTTNITLFNKFWETNTPQTITIKEALDRIKNGNSKDIITKVYKGDKESKKQLPCLMFGGVFKNRSIDGLEQSSGFAILDFDETKNSDNPVEVAKKLREDLKEDPFIYSAWLSPSLKGVKALVKIPKVKNDEEYKEYYLALLVAYPELDHVTKDISRINYESYDPYLWVNEDSEIWKTKYVEPKVEKTQIVNYEQQLHPNYVKKANESILRLATSIITDAVQGTKHDSLLRASTLLGGYIPHVIDESDAITQLEYAVSISGYDKTYPSNKTIRDGIENGKQRKLELNPLIKTKINNHQNKLTPATAPNKITDFSKFISPKGKGWDFIEDFYDGKIEMGVASGVEFLDKHFMWKKNEFYTIAGAKGRGKTSMIQALSLISVLGSGWKWIFSLKENNTEDAKENLFQYLAHAKYKDMRHSKKEETENIKQYIEDHFIFLENITTIEQVLETSKYIIEQNPKDTYSVFIDPANSHLAGYEFGETQVEYSNGSKIAVKILEFSEKYCTVVLSQHTIMSAQRNGIVSSAHAEGGWYTSKSSFTMGIHREQGTSDNKITIDNVRRTRTGGKETKSDNSLIVTWTPFDLHVKMERETYLTKNYILSFIQENIGWNMSTLPTKSDNSLSEYCLLYTSPSPRDRTRSRMPSSA